MTEPQYHPFPCCCCTVSTVLLDEDTDDSIRGSVIQMRDLPLQSSAISPRASGTLIPGNRDRPQTTLKDPQTFYSFHDDSQPMKADWWVETNVSAIATCRGLSLPSPIIAAEFFKLSTNMGKDAPWLPGKWEQLCKELGASTPGKSYMAVWLHMGNSSLVWLSELVAGNAADYANRDVLTSSIKLMLSPVKVSIPMPRKSPKDLDFAGPFFGTGCSTQVTDLGDGVNVACLRFDLYSKWVVKIGLQTAGFRNGNILDIVIIDWQHQAIVSAIQLNCTPTFLNIYNN